MRRFYDKTLVETYLRQTKHESIMRGLQEHLFVAQYEKGEFITMPLQQEHLFQIIIHRRKAQPPAQLVEWDSPPGAKPLHFRLKAV